MPKHPIRGSEEEENADWDENDFQHEDNMDDNW